jgi:predicted nucleic acid-binding protein
MKQVLDHFARARILDFTRVTAEHFARIYAATHRAGRPMGFADAQIAALCSEHEAMLATRDTSDFAACGISVINPWLPPL